MKYVRIKTCDYYNHPEYYAFMPRSIFDALETSVLEGTTIDGDIFAQVPEDDFNVFFSELTNFRNNQNNGNENS